MFLFFNKFFVLFNLILNSYFFFLFFGFAPPPPPPKQCTQCRHFYVSQLWLWLSAQLCKTCWSKCCFSGVKIFQPSVRQCQQLTNLQEMKIFLIWEWFFVTSFRIRIKPKMAGCMPQWCLSPRNRSKVIILFLVFPAYLSQLEVICDKLVRYSFFRSFVNLFGTRTGTGTGTGSNRKENKSNILL